MKSSFIVTVEVGPDDPPLGAWDIQSAIIDGLDVEPVTIAVRVTQESA